MPIFFQKRRHELVSRQFRSRENYTYKQETITKQRVLEIL